MASTVDTQADFVVPEMPSFTKGYHHRPYPAISPSRPEIAAAAAGKNVVITGGGTGIGKAIAIAFAQAGARSVAILGRRADRLQQTAAEIKSAAAEHGHSPIIITEAVDLMQRDKVDSAFQSIQTKVGSGAGATYLDVLVSNAGMAPGMGPVLGYDANVMIETLRINVLSAFNAVNAWMPFSPQDGSAVLLNVSSMTAHAAPMITNFPYSIAKAANLKMIDFFAAENPAVHVVSLQPGIINTELGGEEKPSYVAPDTTDLPGQFCVWLLTPEARFLKNKFVWANWDVEELVARKDEIVGTRALTWGVEGVLV
ncbi:oxidoreductase, short chain dehydrogenase reductase family [Trichoderma arundinaceum]|uniref:Oxidoreductase, short chain dehydrogenase reductase family n=1 Tax=Trichoderma arundinaceum TaxID=490622 RepID=A0A395NAA3_TRIAR|nr:oxidoreductase, short chain dehydrogenase reductase family [Trichoderma arundinaceum]